MKVTTTQGREIELKQDVLERLKTRVKGPVFSAGDVRYDESRSVWNAMIDRRPALVARCLGVADVIECVRFARETDLFSMWPALGSRAH